jgi:glycosyltransferase involved in cell wall biosynthesis
MQKQQKPVDRLSIIVRSSSASRLNFLDQALFSLAVQDWPFIEVLVMLQNPDEAFLQGVNDLIERQPWPEDARVKAVPVAVDTGVDGRARLINAAIPLLTGDYLALLDDDDVVYPSGYAFLIGKLVSNPNAALAAGGCVMAHVKENNGDLYISKKKLGAFDWGNTKFDLLRENFIPIHSYIVDLRRTSKNRILFRDEAVPLEDYDFLLRFADGHEFDVTQRHHLVCEYRIHQGNSIWQAGAEISSNSPSLKRARRYIDDVKEAAKFSITPNELAVLTSHHTAAPAAAVAVSPSVKRLLHRQADRFYIWLERNNTFYVYVTKLYRRIRGL